MIRSCLKSGSLIMSLCLLWQVTWCDAVLASSMGELFRHQNTSVLTDGDIASVVDKEMELSKRPTVFMRYSSSGQSRLNSKNTLAQGRPRSEAKLTPAAAEAADILGVMPQVKRLQQLNQQSTRRPGEMSSDEQLIQEMFILEKIMGGVLEVRAVADRIDRELAYAYDVRAVLLAKKASRLELDYVANFLQFGILSTISGPLFLHAEPLAANMCLLSASGTGIVLGLLGLGLQAGGGGRRKGDTHANMLAAFFDLEPADEHLFPSTVWKYLEATPTGAKESRRQQVLQHWENNKVVNPEKELHLRKICALHPEQEKHYETIGLLSKRIFLLHYVHSEVEQLDAALLALMRACSLY